MRAISDEWIAVDTDLRPIRISDDSWTFQGSREEAADAARKRVEELYGNTPTRQFYDLFPVHSYRVVWASRFGADPRWHVFPKEEN